jgi:DNA polymerase sigma
MILLKINSNFRFLSNKLSTKSSSLSLQRNESKFTKRTVFNLKTNPKKQLAKDKENDLQNKGNKNQAEKFHIQQSLFANSQNLKQTPSKSSNSFSNESLAMLLKNLKESNRMVSFETIEEEILARRVQARNTIYFIFESDSKKHLANLLSDCKSIGVHTNQIFHLNDSCLIEFSSEECVNKIVKEHSKQMTNILALKNRTICYVSKVKDEQISPNDQKFILQYTINEPRVDNYKVDTNGLSSLANFNEQLRELYSKNKLDEFNLRIRYFIASLLEERLKFVFPECVCLPFGSSVNKLGMKLADLDLNLLFTREEFEFLKNEYGKFSSVKSNHLNGELFFINKLPQSSSPNSDYKQIALFNLVENVVSNLIAKFETKEVIKNARVPIIKFDFIAKPGINCDLSMTNNRISFNMTKLFWIYTHLDERVLLLTFFVRYWASLMKIQAKKRPTPNFTNYQLSMLVFNFLLRLEDPMVIPLEDITETSGKNVIVKNLTISEFNNLLKNKNKQNIGELFKAFLKYYVKFDFQNSNISLSKTQKVTEFQVIFIENPFQPGINTAHNVNLNQVNRFKACCKKTLDFIGEPNNIDLHKLITILVKVNSVFK